MAVKLSHRLEQIVDALPLRKGMRVLEIGCGPGAMAREIAQRIGNGHILAIDRSSKAVLQAISGSQAEIEAGCLSFRQVAVEDFILKDGELPFDIAVAVRVGALDGRHPEIEKQALLKISGALTPEGQLFIDGGAPLTEIPLDKYR
ncbi:MAG: methyltransferase domain-containing protein [Prolixibacteraceae bacterium]|nr:methyltransferase domain-containing protein [Prolixibacteraceae bacterium]